MLIQSVTISRGGKSGNHRLRLPLLADFILFPTSSLHSCWDARCRMIYVQVDCFQQTTVKGIFCAGEPTASEVWSCRWSRARSPVWLQAGHEAAAKQLFAQREKCTVLRRALCIELSAPRAELVACPFLETIVCRCEDVSYSRIAQHGVLAFRETADSLRNGPVPGTGLRTAPPASCLAGRRIRCGRPFSHSS